MSATVFQIIGILIVCLITCSGADQRKHQSSTSLACVRGIHHDQWFSSQKASNAENVPFDHVAMNTTYVPELVFLSP